MANKSDRHRAILGLITAQVVGSQEELRHLMVAKGWDVTQSTLSRDLREMRVARVPGPDGSRYAVLEGAAEEQRATLETLLTQFFYKIDGVRELIVLTTTAGGAQPVAEAIDAAGFSDVIGTVGGENTILIIMRSDAAREKLMQRLRALAGHDD